MPSENIIREISSAEKNQFENLLNTCFPVLPGTSFFDDFPIWNPELFKNAIRLGYFEKKNHELQLQGSACARFSTMRLAHGQIVNAALVGAVATHADQRGKGIASKLIEELLKRIDERKVSLTLLWGSEHDLYRRFGFELAGEQIRISIATFLSANPAEKLAANETLQEEYSPSIFTKRKMVKEGLILDTADEDWYSKHKNVKWYSLRRAGIMTAYIAFGRGIDLPHMVHEWDGPIEDVLKLFAAILARDPQAEWLTSDSFLKQWGIDLSNNSEIPREYLCMARPAQSGLWVWGLDAC